MSQTHVVDRIRIEDFERYHAPRFRMAPPPVSIKEVIVTMLICTVMAPFLFTTFFVIPMMGQVTVGLAGFVTALYLWFRKSFVIALTVLASAGILSTIAFMSIQSIKYRIDVTMFILIALGIPMTFIFTVFVGMKVWELRGGGE
ncbi:MAG: hypothetical protein RL518_603 [Pseudomonadota bacterium]